MLLQNGHFLEIGGKRIHHLNVEEINKHAVKEGYFYHAGRSHGGKLVYLFGRIDNHVKEHVPAGNVNVYTIGQEVVCTMALGTVAFADIPRKLIVGRKRSAHFLMWNRVNALRGGGVKNEAKKKLTLFGLISLTGLSEKDLLKSKPQDIDDRLKKASEQYLKCAIAHEFGHFREEQHLSQNMFEEGLRVARENLNHDLEGFVYALSDTIADTIDAGLFHYILELEEPIRFGLLSLHFADLL